MRKINIKNVSVGQLIQFGEHYHTVLDNEIDCSNMKGTVMHTTDQIIINLHNTKYQSDLEEFQTNFGENNLIFNFPDDDEQYNDVEVTVCTKEEQIEYSAIIKVVGDYRATVKAYNKAEALQLFHSGAFTEADEFSLMNCTSLEAELETYHITKVEDEV